MRTTAALLATTALAGAGLAVQTAEATTPTVKIARTSVGRIMETGRGQTVYLFTHDTRNHDRCISQSGCAGTWPPLTVSGRPIAGAGVNGSLLGTITISGGRHQVTYAGHPLYRYAADSSPGDTSYIGVSSFHGTWYGVSPTGGSVR